MAFEQLKERQSVVWGDAPFENVAAGLADAHEAILEAVAPVEEARWLDVACGTGELAVMAAARGAEVVGVDFSPALIETAGRNAEAAGRAIDFRVGDAEALDVPDASFDIVTSTCGAMFAPDQEATASELGRVAKPGGRLAMVNWTLEGGVGELFALMKPFMPPPPEGVPSPFEWGRREWVEELLGDDYELDIDERVSMFSAPSGEDYWQLFVTSYGPTKALAASLDDHRREELRRNWVDFFEQNYRTGDGIEHPRQYLLVRGTRR
jgi:SAM-dependent methyltransferase